MSGSLRVAQGGGDWAGDVSVSMRRDWVMRLEVHTSKRRDWIGAVCASKRKDLVGAGMHK
jgi:hypothetical protein